MPQNLHWTWKFLVELQCQVQMPKLTSTYQERNSTSYSILRKSVKLLFFFPAFKILHNRKSFLKESVKVQHLVTIGSNNHASWYFSKRTENSCPHENLPMNVYSNFVQNWQNLEATRTSFSTCKHKLWYIHSTE